MATLGLRERKKADTRKAIARAALALAVERGPDAVTVDDIAVAADVSPRTVFNHFGSKDEAILGTDPDGAREVAAALLLRPASETPLQAFRAVFEPLLTGSDDAGELWRARARLVADHPHLRAAQSRSQHDFERVLEAAVAERTGLDPARSGYPRLVVTVAFAAIRTALERGAAAGRAGLRRELRAAFDDIEAGLAVPPGGRRP